MSPTALNKEGKIIMQHSVGETAPLTTLLILLLLRTKY